MLGHAHEADRLPDRRLGGRPQLGLRATFRARTRSSPTGSRCLRTPTPAAARTSSSTSAGTTRGRASRCCCGPGRGCGARRTRRLHVIGADPRAVRLLMTRQKLTDDGIELMGVIVGDPLTAELARAKLLCAPSLGGESFGMVLTRAFGCATPVVASDIPGYDQVMAPEVGLTVPPGDSEPLGYALIELLSDEQRRQRLGEGCTRARARALRLGQAGRAPGGHLRGRGGAGGLESASAGPFSAEPSWSTVHDQSPHGLRHAPGGDQARARDQGARAAPGRRSSRASASPAQHREMLDQMLDAVRHRARPRPRGHAARAVAEPRDRRRDRRPAADPRGGAARLGARPGRHDDDDGRCARRLPPRHQGRARRGGPAHVQQARSRGPRR